MPDVRELRIALTVDDYERAVGDRNVRVRAPDGMQLTLFSLSDD